MKKNKVKQLLPRSYCPVPNLGFSLIEMLVVIAVFAVLGVIISRVVIVSMKNSSKSEAQIRVRENLAYALSVIERQLRNVKSINPCNGTDTTIISYTDYEDRQSSFSCELNPPASRQPAYIASGSAVTGRLTATDVDIVSCNFVCTPATSTTPPSVRITVSASDVKETGSTGATVSMETTIFLRSY
jgi:prepilin-type N-terminal cleavage/methylation domain-containing protein